MTTTEDPMPAEDVLPRTRRKRRRYNWTRLKAEYVEGITDDQGKVRWPTYAEVAQRNDVNASNLRDRAATEHWTDERAAFQRRIEAARQNDRAAELAALGADLDVNALRLARNGLAVTAARLQELGTQAQTRIEALRQTGGRITTATPPPADSDELRTLSLAGSTWYDLGTKALGLTPNLGRLEVDQHTTVDLVAEIDVTMSDDERAVRLMAILHEAGVLPDVGPRDVLDVAGSDAYEVPPGADPEDEQVHPPDVDDTSEPEPETTGVPATRSA